MTLPPLILISDAERVGEERFLEVLAAARAGGLRWVQVREPSWDGERVRLLLLRVLAMAPRGSLTAVNRRTELALDLDLAGVHIGGGNPEEVRAARRLLGPGRLIGYSAHSREELLQAAEAGADYAFYSPIYAPISKRHALAPVGIDGLRRACRSAPLPVYALGGMTPERASPARKAGAAGVAAMGAVLDAPNPEAVTREFLAAWEGAG